MIQQTLQKQIIKDLKYLLQAQMFQIANNMLFEQFFARVLASYQWGLVLIPCWDMSVSGALVYNVDDLGQVSPQKWPRRDLSCMTVNVNLQVPDVNIQGWTTCKCYSVYEVC